MMHASRLGASHMPANLALMSPWDSPVPGRRFIQCNTYIIHSVHPMHFTRVEIKQCLHIKLAARILQSRLIVITAVDDN